MSENKFYLKIQLPNCREESIFSEVLGAEFRTNEVHCVRAEQTSVEIQRHIFGIARKRDAEAKVSVTYDDPNKGHQGWLTLEGVDLAKCGPVLQTHVARSSVTGRL